MLFSGTVHDDLRSVAMAITPSLIDCVNATGDKAQVQQPFTSIIGQMFKVLSEEEELEVVQNLAMSIKEVILAACRPAGVRFPFAFSLFLETKFLCSIMFGHFFIVG